MSGERPNPDELQQFYTSTLVKLMVRHGDVDPVEVTSAKTASGNWLWVARLIIDDFLVETIWQSSELGSQKELVLNAYREEVVGYWLLSGENDSPSWAFPFENEPAQEVAHDIAADYLAGGAVS